MAHNTTSTIGIQKKKMKRFPELKVPVKFDRQNVIKTSHMLGAARSYGFMRASKTTTPFPVDERSVDPKLLALRLATVAQEQESTSGTSGTSESKVSKTSVSLNERQISDEIDLELKAKKFAEKRRKFYEGEFSITRGKKLSEVSHPLPNKELGEGIGVQYTKQPSALAMKLIENYCKKENLKIWRGFS